MLIPQTDRQTDRQREAPTAANQEIDTLVTQRILSEITGVKKKKKASKIFKTASVGESNPQCPSYPSLTISATQVNSCQSPLD